MTAITPSSIHGRNNDDFNTPAGLRKSHTANCVPGRSVAGWDPSLENGIHRFVICRILQKNLHGKNSVEVGSGRHQLFLNVLKHFFSLFGNSSPGTSPRNLPGQIDHSVMYDRLTIGRMQVNTPNRHCSPFFLEATIKVRRKPPSSLRY